MNIYLLLVIRFLKATRKGILSFLSLFSIIGIMLGVSALIIVLGIMNGFKGEIESRLLKFTPHITIIPNIQNLNYNELVNEVKKFEGVKETKKYIIVKTIVKANDKMDGIVLKAVDSNYDELKSTLISGNLDIENGVIIGKGLAQKLNVLDGDSIAIFSSINFAPHKFKISGIVDAGIYDINEHFILTSIENVNRIGNFQISGIEVYVKNISDAQKVANNFRMKLDNVLIYTWIDLNRNLFSALELEKLGMFLVVFLITLVASFNIISTLSILSEHKIYDIGILRVFGFKNKDILIVFFLLGITIGTIGVILGNLIGILISFLVTDMKIIRLNPQIYFIDYIPIKSSFKDYFMISAFAFLIIFVFSIVPSIKIAKLKLLDALKK